MPALFRNRVAWIVAVLVQGFAHVSRYQMGNASLLPPESVLERWGAGQLSGTVRGLDVVTSPDRWLRFQDTVNTVLGHLPGHEAFSILSVVMFVATIVMVAALFDLAQHPVQGPLESAAVR